MIGFSRCLTVPVLLTLATALFNSGVAAERKGSLDVDLDLGVASSAVPAGVLRVPVLGYAVFSHTRDHSPIELRPILGVPQAAGLGAPISLPAGITRLALAPRQDYALVQIGSARIVQLMPLEAGAASELIAIQGAFDSPDRIDFSPNGAVAALYSSRHQGVQLIGGLPAAPRVLGVRPALVSWGRVSAVAVSDDGTAVLLGSSDGENGAVTMLPANGEPRTLLSAAVPSALRFVSQTHDALLADSKRNQILLMKDTTGTFASSALAVEVQGVSAPSEIEISSDQRYVLVVNGDAKGLLVIDINSGNISTLTSASKHSNLGRIGRSGGLFTSLHEDGTAWLIETARSGAQVFLLPNLRADR